MRRTFPIDNLKGILRSLGVGQIVQMSRRDSSRKMLPSGLADHPETNPLSELIENTFGSSALAGQSLITALVLSIMAGSDVPSLFESNQSETLEQKQELMLGWIEKNAQVLKNQGYDLTTINDFRRLASIFMPGNVVVVAYETEKNEPVLNFLSNSHAIPTLLQEIKRHNPKTIDIRTLSPTQAAALSVAHERDLLKVRHASDWISVIERMKMGSIENAKPQQILPILEILRPNLHIPADFSQAMLSMERRLMIGPSLNPLDVVNFMCEIWVPERPETSVDHQKSSSEKIEQQLTASLEKASVQPKEENKQVQDNRKHKGSEMKRNHDKSSNKVAGIDTSKFKNVSGKKKRKSLNVSNEISSHDLDRIEAQLLSKKKNQEPKETFSESDMDEHINKLEAGYKELVDAGKNQSYASFDMQSVKDKIKEIEGLLNSDINTQNWGLRAAQQGRITKLTNDLREQIKQLHHIVAKVESRVNQIADDSFGEVHRTLRTAHTVEKLVSSSLHLLKEAGVITPKVAEETAKLIENNPAVLRLLTNPSVDFQSLDIREIQKLISPHSVSPHLLMHSDADLSLTASEQSLLPVANDAFTEEMSGALIGSVSSLLMTLGRIIHDPESQLVIVENRDGKAAVTAIDVTTLTRESVSTLLSSMALGSHKRLMSLPRVAVERWHALNDMNPVLVNLNPNETFAVLRGLTGAQVNPEILPILSRIGYSQENLSLVSHHHAPAMRTIGSRAALNPMDRMVSMFALMFALKRFTPSNVLGVGKGTVSFTQNMDQNQTIIRNPSIRQSTGQQPSRPMRKQPLRIKADDKSHETHDVPHLKRGRTEDGNEMPIKRARIKNGNEMPKTGDKFDETLGKIANFEKDIASLIGKVERVKKDLSKNNINASLIVDELLVKLMNGHKGLTSNINLAIKTNQQMNKDPMPDILNHIESFKSLTTRAIRQTQKELASEPMVWKMLRPILNALIQVVNAFINTVRYGLGKPSQQTFHLFVNPLERFNKEIPEQPFTDDKPKGPK